MTNIFIKTNILEKKIKRGKETKEKKEKKK